MNLEQAEKIADSMGCVLQPIRDGRTTIVVKLHLAEGSPWDDRRCRGVSEKLEELGWTGTLIW